MFMSDTFCNSDCRESLIDEQGDMGVADVVDTDLRNAAPLATVLQVVLQEVGRARDDAFVGKRRAEASVFYMFLLR